MLSNTQISNLPLVEIHNLGEIIEKAKILKTTMIVCSRRDMFGSSPEGFVFSHTTIDDYVPDFIFSCNQFTNSITKVLIEKTLDPDNNTFYLIPNKCIVEKNDLEVALKADPYTADQWDFPNLRIGSCDQFLEYHRSILSQIGDVLKSVVFFESNYSLPSFEKFSIENFQDNEAFQFVMSHRKEYGVQRTVISNNGKNFVLSLYKNILPYKKGDKVRLSIMTSYGNTFYAKFHLMRKNNIEIKIYAKYLNLI